MANHVTSVCILGWNALWTPRLSQTPKPGETAKYNADLLFTAEDEKSDEFLAIKKDFNQIIIDAIGLEKARVWLKEEKIKSIFNRKLESSKYDADKFSCFIKTKTTKKPGIVSTKEDPANRGKPAPITDPEEVFMGCKVRAIIGLKWFEMPDKTNRGVTVYLNGLQVVDNKVQRLDGRLSAADAFGFTEAANDVDLSIGAEENLADLLE